MDARVCPREFRFYINSDRHDPRKSKFKYDSKVARGALVGNRTRELPFESDRTTLCQGGRQEAGNADNIINSIVTYFGV